ncbi:response regulator [Pedobacter alpinus]|uniref:Response regulator n=1 Tax=Pedobacter alpinus TaxID=1590643 RepID=A0ABW5TXF6_9SPHI
MFKKVLIAEDHESANLSVRKTLDEFGVKEREYVYYCDDALMHLKQALAEGNPYELLITDIFFEEDGRAQDLKGGIDLIKAAKALQPHILVLVFSAESKVGFIDQLFKEMGINAYVRKARRDVEELKNALTHLANDKQYLNPALRQSIKKQNTYEFSDYDIILISQLSQGMLQKDIPYYLEKNEIKPYGLSSVEKRLNFMKATLGFSKNEQLIAFCKDLGII